MSWLEPNGGARWNIQTMTARRLSIERKRPIGLGEVIMAANLDWPVAGIGNLEHDGRTILVENNFARSGEYLTWNHSNSPRETVLVARLPNLLCSRTIFSRERRMLRPMAIPAT